MLPKIRLLTVSRAMSSLMLRQLPRTSERQSRRRLQSFRVADQGARIIFDDDSRRGVAMGKDRLRQSGICARLGRLAAMLLAVTASGGIFAAPAWADSRHSVSDQIAFYGDIGNAVNSAYRKNPLLVRPSMLLLTEDGSVALIHLRWSGWGTSIARATGVWSASDCTPSCATGKRTQRPARLTLSSPGRVVGHRVYRCFRITPPHPRRDIADRACIRKQGAIWAYMPTPAR